MVAVWLSFTPALIAVTPARLGQPVTEESPSAAGVCKYLYAHADPVMFSDPTGHFVGISTLTAVGIATAVLGSLAIATFGVLTASSVGAGPAIETQIQLTELHKKWGNFHCCEFADEAKSFLEKKKMRYGEDFTIIEYESKPGMTRGDWVFAVPGFGRFGGQQISSNRNHRGIFLSNERRRWSFLTGTVSDNNVVGVSLGAWLTGYEVSVIGAHDALIADAPRLGIGEIRFLKDNGKFGFAP
jgi:hypothetical protein